MKSKRSRVLFLAVSVAVAGQLGACAVSNGDPLPNNVFDASPLQVAPGTGTGPDGARDADAGLTTSSRDAEPDPNTVVDAGKDAAPNHEPVQISEIFVDNDGLGDGAEFVELRAAPGTPADDLRIRVLDSTGQVKYDLNVGVAGATFNGNGIWVIGGKETYKLNVSDHVDRELALNTWGLDNLRGAIQLLRGATLLDVVGYDVAADAGALPPPSSPPTPNVEGRPAYVPAPPTGSTFSKKHRSFGRPTGSADTGSNLSDFCAMEASPGFVQKPCLP
jgi:hypothetical protein